MTATTAEPDLVDMDATTSKEVISKPGPHDVLLGRGGGTNNHAGNVKFRKLVNEHKMRYLACSKVEKPKVAREVVHLWRNMEPPGRFLARKDDSKRGPGSVKDSSNEWLEVGDKKAREKASQCLRERTPDVLPYIQQLRKHQDEMTEQGVSRVHQQLKMQQQQEEEPLPAFERNELYASTTGMMMNTAAFPRRNSMPAAPQAMMQQHQLHHANAGGGGPHFAAFGRRGSMPAAPTSMGGHFHAGGMARNPAFRRGSLPSVPSQFHHPNQYPEMDPYLNGYGGGAAMGMDTLSSGMYQDPYSFQGNSSGGLGGGAAWGGGMGGYDMPMGAMAASIFHNSNSSFEMEPLYPTTAGMPTHTVVPMHNPGPHFVTDSVTPEPAPSSKAKRLAGGKRARTSTPQQSEPPPASVTPTSRSSEPPTTPKTSSLSSKPSSSDKSPFEDDEAVVTLEQYKKQLDDYMINNQISSAPQLTASSSEADDDSAAGLDDELMFHDSSSFLENHRDMKAWHQEARGRAAAARENHQISSDALSVTSHKSTLSQSLSNLSNISMFSGISGDKLAISNHGDGDDPNHAEKMDRDMDSNMSVMSGLTDDGDPSHHFGL